MTDIVERLRDRECKFCDEAADEIVRLRTLVQLALRGLHNDFEPDNQSALYYRIKAAIDSSYVEKK